MIKGFFFDLDGTLVDTHQSNYRAYKKALEEFGVTIDFEAFKKTIGHQAQTFLPWLAPGLTAEQYQRVAEQKAGFYKDLLHVSRLNTKLMQFLDLVSADNYIVLISTARRVNAAAVLKHYHLTERFNFIITREDVKETKPHPAAYELALAKTGLQANEAIAFEDSEAGRQAAEAAGIVVVMIKNFAV